MQSLCCDASSWMSTASSFNVDHFLFILFGLLHLVRLHKLRYLLPLVLRRLSIIEPLEPFDGLFFISSDFINCAICCLSSSAGSLLLNLLNHLMASSSSPSWSLASSSKLSVYPVAVFLVVTALVLDLRVAVGSMSFSSSSPSTSSKFRAFTGTKNSCSFKSASFAMN